VRNNQKWYWMRDSHSATVRHLLGSTREIHSHPLKAIFSRLNFHYICIGKSEWSMQSKAAVMSTEASSVRPFVHRLLIVRHISHAAWRSLLIDGCATWTGCMVISRWWPLIFMCLCQATTLSDVFDMKVTFESEWLRTYEKY